jgi:hypothetical protein
MKGTGEEGVHWIHVAQDRDQCEKGQQILDSIKYREFLTS